MTTSPSSRPPSADETRRLLEERYGIRPPGRRWRVVLPVAALAVAGLGWLVWAASAASDQDVEAELVSWRVVSPHAVQAELVISRDHGDEVGCTLVAQAADAIVVGEQPVRLPAGDPGEHRLEATIETEREATAVRLTDCE